MIRPRNSVFLKLLFVFALAGAANVGITYFFFQHLAYSDVRRMHRMENMAEYGKLLSAQLGYPPSEARMRELELSIHLRTRVDGPEVAVASSPEVPTFEAVDQALSLRLDREGSRVGRFRDFLAVETQRGQARYLFLMESSDALDGHPNLILGLISVLLLILLLTYLSIRMILRPLRSIETGVQAVASGNIDVTLPCPPEPKGDELGRLARTFNLMTERVRSMIRSKERLLLDVSHEFRSPLTRIKVAIELPGEDARASMQRSVRELDAMISELLESARLDDAQGKLRLERIDLYLLLDELCSRYKGEQPGVLLKPASGDYVCDVDPSRICTAIQNLLENALKYSSQQDRSVEVGISRSPGGIRIQVRDYGIGISTEDQSLIFEPFYRVDRSRVKASGGYGLGLSLTKKIIEAHRGRIAVASQVGRETVFTVEIPANA